MINYSSISLTEVTPVTEPVSLDDLKAWLKVDFPDDDDLIISVGKSARQSLEQFLNLTLVAKTVKMDVDFESDCQKLVILPYASGVSGVTVDSLDDTDNTTTLASGTDYFIRGNQIRIGAGRYHIEYTTVPNVPEALKEAVKMEVAQRYADRGENSTTSGLSEAAKAKAQAYQIIWL